MNKIEFGNNIDIMKSWSEQGVKVQTCITSPPYFGLRSYLDNDDPQKVHEVGLEQTPKQYVDKMVEVFRAVKDILADDGTLWVNIGDSYASYRQGGVPDQSMSGKSRDEVKDRTPPNRDSNQLKQFGIKNKDLIGIPWMLAFALREDGWYLRQDIIWSKPNPMPESVKDRCTKAHEYIFLLSKSERYYYDYEAVKITASQATLDRNKYGFNGAFKGQFAGSPVEKRWQEGRPIENPEFSKDGKANRRSVWTVATRPYKGAHFATFPPDLIEPCILAGSKVGDIILDPFMGSGTTAAVALKHNRQYLGCELNQNYAILQQQRIDEQLKSVGQVDSTVIDELFTIEEPK